MKCDFCNSNNTYVKTHKHKYLIKEREIEFESDRSFCKECNKIVYDSELDNIASQKAINIYNQNYGIPKEKIIELRTNYNLSQELFAKIIGCAKKTLISYEKGTSIPNDNYFIILKTLISNPNIIVSLIEANKEQFTDKEYSKIENKVISRLGNNTKQLFSEEEYVPTQYNGYAKINKNKILNMILSFAEKGILKTKLLKEMFYADFISYKETGTSITGLEYAKLPFGPVPDDFDEILSNYTKKGYINYKIEFNENLDCEYHKISSKINIDKNVFSKEELKIINKVKQYFKNFKSKDIVDYSHKEKAFLETKFNKKIDYNYAFDIDLK